MEQDRDSKKNNDLENSGSGQSYLTSTLMNSAGTESVSAKSGARDSVNANSENDATEEARKGLENGVNEDTSKDSTKDSEKNLEKNSNKDATKDANKNAWKGLENGVNEDTTKDAPKDSEKNLEKNSNKDATKDANRRDFLTFVTSGFAGVGACCAAWPLIDSMNPAEDVLANSSTEVDLTNIKPGQSVTVKWRGKPVFIKNRTPEEIMESRNADLEKLRDAEPDEKRVKPSHDKWLVVVGTCTHLGCVPINDKNGWFCPCHGSYYDHSGRVTAGPAPKNLEIPPYDFVTDTKIKIG